MVFINMLSTLALAGLARATVTSVVYITEYETNCNVCTASSQALVVVATASTIAQTVVTTAQTVKATSSVVAQGPVVVAPKVISTSSYAVPSSVVSIATTSSSAIEAPTAVVAAASKSIQACPASSHVDALGSKNYPRIITPVSSTYPDTVYGPQYFASIGNGNSTIFTFDYQTAGTCTLEFKFPTTQQIEALNGTTSYSISSSSIDVTLYQLAGVASANADYTTKPARAAAFDAVLTPGTNSTITSFACPVGTSVSYELVATNGNSLTWFEDYNRKGTASVPL